MMAIYQFAPSPDVSTQEQNFATWENGFSESEISSIRKIGDALSTANSVINSGKTDEAIRKSKVSWIGLNDDTLWLYDRLAYIGRMLNGQFWEFDLYGFVEDFQYTVYSNSNEHYSWHMDKGNLETSPRKLSLVVQLSHPTEYEGGELQLQLGPNITTANKTQGLIYAFPSWVLHRVTPVTKGTRKSLVVWMAGPKFR